MSWTWVLCQGQGWETWLALKRCPVVQGQNNPSALLCMISKIFFMSSWPAVNCFKYNWILICNGGYIVPIYSIYISIKKEKKQHMLYYVINTEWAVALVCLFVSGFLQWKRLAWGFPARFSITGCLSTSSCLYKLISGVCEGYLIGIKLVKRGAGLNTLISLY